MQGDILCSMLSFLSRYETPLPSLPFLRQALTLFPFTRGWLLFAAMVRVLLILCPILVAESAQVQCRQNEGRGDDSCAISLICIDMLVINNSRPIANSHGDTQQPFAHVGRLDW